MVHQYVLLINLIAWIVVFFWSPFSLLVPMFLQDDFSSIDDTVNGPKAFFANMPLSKTLTMNLDVPEPWLVEPVIAMYISFSI